MSAPVPAWLQAWRDQQQRGEQPPPQPRKVRTQGCNTGKHPARAVAAAQRKAHKPKINMTGFIEPERWDYDGGKRREAVIDHDHNPPRTVRRIGWRICMTCDRPFFSEDVVALRRCERCKAPRDQRKLLSE